MKLLFITHNWYGEGTAVRAMHLARQMVRRGHRVTLLATSKNRFRSERFVEDGVDVALAPHFRDSHRGGWGWLDIPWRSLWVMGGNWDLVHAYDHKPNVVVPTWIQKVLKKTPVVSDWADWWGGDGVNRNATGLKAWVEERSELRVRHLAGWVTAISPVLKERALALGLSKQHVLFLPGGGDPRKVWPKSRLACRKTLGLDPKKVYGVYLGLGMADMPLVLEGLKKCGSSLGLLLLGPNESEKKKMAAAAQVLDRCVIPGRVSDADLPDWLSSADFGLIPLVENTANRARWPNKVGDYAAAGLPILANPTGPLAVLLIKEKAGTIVPASAEGFARGMRQMSVAPEKRRAMGQRARAWLKRDLDWASLAKKLESFFEKVLAA